MNANTNLAPVSLECLSFAEEAQKTKKIEQTLNLSVNSSMAQTQGFSALSCQKVKRTIK